MSSAEDDYSKGNNKSKPRRVTRACDSCRRKKIRCDGATMEGGKCSNCNQYSFDCTYVEAAKKRGPPKGYVEGLEARLGKMEALLQRLCPDADFTKELGTHMDREQWYNEKQKRGGSSSTFKQSRPPSPAPANTGASQLYNSTSLSDEFPGSDDEHSHVPEDEFKRLTTSDRRFHGKSSGLGLVQKAFDMKREITGADFSNPEPTPKGHEFWADSTWDGKRVRAPDEIEVVNFEFPPPDLMEKLIPHYFYHNNLYLPLLHRPTFERNYRDNLHNRDAGYASVLLLVCAIAARSSDDPRVLRTGLGSEEDMKHSAGWKYFDQLHMHRKSLTSPATLADLQQYALAAIFLQGSTVPYASWVMVGIGLRVAQDVGAHRKRTSSGTMTVEDELWKRAFWVLVNLDRMGSAALGRPCAIHDEDFDLDPPLEVDDEYWENPNPEEAFKQPPHIPSTVSYFSASIKLDQILSFALRTIYSINKTKMVLGFGGTGPWEQHIVAELDTRLNSWLDSVPAHLKWDARNDEENAVFFQQTAILYATYYHIQILVHRPFIPGPRKQQTLSFPSLTICTNAARSCARVLDVQRHKCDAGPAPHLMFYAFTSGLVLLLNIWGVNKPGGVTVDTDAAMQDVHKCMQFLGVAEKRWHLAGRLKDILCELASVGEFPLPHPSPDVNSHKRERDSDSPKSMPLSEYNAVPVSDQPRVIARPNSIIAQRRSLAPTAPASTTDFNTLPLNTADLGRMPLHPDFYPQQAQGPAEAPMAWFSDAPDAFGAPMQLFGGPADAGPAAQMFPGSGPPFVGDFPQQQQAFPGPGQQQGSTGAGQGTTLDMWSTAPGGFEWDDWGQFATNIPNIIPGARPDEQNNQQPR